MPEKQLFHYAHKNTPIHQLDPRIKLLQLIVFSFTVLTTGGWGMLILYSFLVFAMGIARVNILHILRDAIPFLIFLCAVFLFSILGSSQGGETNQFGKGSVFVFGFLFVFLISSFLINTTPLKDLRKSVVWFLKPVPFIKEKEFALMFTFTIALIPQLFDIAGEIGDAQKARGMNKSRPLTRIKVFGTNMLKHAVLKAEERIQALEARGLTENRTEIPIEAETSGLTVSAALLPFIVCAAVIIWV